MPVCFESNVWQKMSKAARAAAMSGSRASASQDATAATAREAALEAAQVRRLCLCFASNVWQARRHDLRTQKPVQKQTRQAEAEAASRAADARAKKRQAEENVSWRPVSKPMAWRAALGVSRKAEGSETPTNCKQCFHI